MFEGRRSARTVMQKLTQYCMHIRDEIRSMSDEREKEKLVLRHIEQFEDGKGIQGLPGGVWFNVSERLNIPVHLKGKITILDFFTYCCINCMHILPDLEALEKRFSVEDGLVVVGVHSAKFENEKFWKNLCSAVQRLNIIHPVLNDTGLKLWRGLHIVCWPTLVMLGPDCQPLAVFMGEGHREELFLYTKVALAYFKSLNRISPHSLPLKPARHLLPSSAKILAFPGKVTVFLREQEEILVVSDSGNNRILVSTTDGKVEYVIGGYDPGFKDGEFRKAKFNAPQGVCYFKNAIYVADTKNHAIRKIDLLEKTVTTVAGTGVQGHDLVGGKMGKDQALSSPWDVTVYSSVLVIAMAGTHQLWALFLEDATWWDKTKKYKAGTCIAIVGSGREENRNNHYPQMASLAQPSGLAIVENNNTSFIYLADSESSTVRKVNLPYGRVSAVCGGCLDPADLHGYGDIDGQGRDAKLQHPLGIAWNQVRQEIYVADTYNHKIKKVDVKDNCETIYGFEIPDSTFHFDEPSGLAVSTNGNILYVADTNSHAVKAIDLEKNKIFSIPFVLPEENLDEADSIYLFDTVISTHQSKLLLSFDLTFHNDLKLNTEAPQRWSVSLKPQEWKPESTDGSLSTPISIKIPASTETNKKPSELHITLDVVVCKVNVCIPKQVQVKYRVHRQSDAPSTVTEKRPLTVE